MARPFARAFSFPCTTPAAANYLLVLSDIVASPLEHSYAVTFFFGKCFATPYKVFGLLRPGADGPSWPAMTWIADRKGGSSVRSGKDVKA